MSTVYLALDEKLHKTWAIKEIDRSKDSLRKQSAMYEIYMMQKLDHPLLPRIVDIIEHHDKVFVVMDYVEGIALSHLLERRGRFSEKDVLLWAKELALVLEYLHSREPPIIYRDMKPANIILQRSGHVKLVDFGAAREFKPDCLHDTVNLGTRGYAAPEQFGGCGQSDERTDIYSLGVTLYHLVTGCNPSKPPYEVLPRNHLKKGISPKFLRIIEIATNNDPNKRYSSAKALLSDLNQIQSSSFIFRKKHYTKKNLFLIIGLILSISVSIGIGTYILGFLKETNHYHHQLTLAENEVDERKSEAYLLEAIAMRPKEVEPYLLYAKTAKLDEIFSLEEEKEIRTFLDDNLESLRQQEDYALLALEYGKLYWYYYEYGVTNPFDIRITGMKAALPWFLDVLIYAASSDAEYALADVYARIGTFHKDITLQINESEQAGAYQSYFSLLKELSMISVDSPERARLEAVRLGFSSLENYARCFAADEITKEEQFHLFETFRELLSETHPISENGINLKEDLINRIQWIESEIGDAYETTGTE